MVSPDAIGAPVYMMSIDSSSNDTEASTTIASLVYATSQTPFLYPPLGFTSQQVLETLVLPNISLAFPLWYLVPPLGTAATNVIALGLKPLGPEEPQLTEAAVENASAREIPTAKPVTTTKKITKRGKKVVTPTMQRDSSTCAICDVTGHPTHICLELDELKPLLHCEAGTSTWHSHKKELATKITSKPLHTNHACTIYDTYGHYNHHCPEIP